MRVVRVCRITEDGAAAYEWTTIATDLRPAADTPGKGIPHRLIDSVSSYKGFGDAHMRRIVLAAGSAMK